MTATIGARPDRVALGIALIVTAVFMMSIQEALFKRYSADLSLWQMFTLRGLLAVPMLVGIVTLRGQQRTLWSEALMKWPLLRSFYMTSMFIVVYSSLPFLSLSTVAAGVYTAPIFVTLLSAYAIGEPVGVRGWLAIAIGFIGVLIILQPGADAFSFWALLPVLGGFLYALSNVTTRSHCQGISLPALSLSLSLILLLAGAILSIGVWLWQPESNWVAGYPFLFSAWTVLDTTEWIVMLLLAALVVAVGMALAGAYQAAPPATVATFDYSYLVFVALWDYLVFDTPPTGATTFGILLIIGAGLMVVRRPSNFAKEKHAMNNLFDESIDNTATSSLKWEFRVADGGIEPFDLIHPKHGEDQVLPMWVADMDFHAAAPIRRAVEARAAHGVFGYAVPAQRYFAAVAGWMQRRHNWEFDQEWIVPTPGVVPGIHLLVKRLTRPGDKILIQRPVYHPFTYAAVNNDRISVSNSLNYDGARYWMDFDDLEEKVRDPRVKIVLLCSPHNPVGRIWTRDELERFAEICVRNDVIVAADEIHADLVMPGNNFFAYGRLPPELRSRSIICTAPSKSFNVAGLQTANLIIEDAELRDALRAEIRSTGLYTMSPFGIAATQAAYEEGDEWLDQAVAHISGNMQFAQTYLRERIPAIKPIACEATYLLWLDCRELGLRHIELKSLVLDKAKLYLDEGEIFGEEGSGFMRINLACSREMVERAMARLRQAISEL